VGNDSQLIAYDDAGGAYAARLWWMARWLGHRQVAVLDGGIQAWRSAGGALQAGEVTAESRIFEPGSGPDFITSAEVVAALADPGRLLVDARSPERYAGAVEPLDAVAGHVPGAVNQPFMVNLDAAGRFKPPAELKRLWQERLGGRPAAAVIAMCGSGVTACQNLLALESAGLGGAGLYAGSWSEWIRDPKRPVARGGAPA
jgi:thiosulfate/3-mercaptopyruvate sulfurtransferase